MELTQANTEALIQLRGLTITSISYFGITRAIHIDCIQTIGQMIGLQSNGPVFDPIELNSVFVRF